MLLLKIHFTILLNNYNFDLDLLKNNNNYYYDDLSSNHDIKEIQDINFIYKNYNPYIALFVKS